MSFEIEVWVTAYKAFTNEEAKIIFKDLALRELSTEDYETFLKEI